MALQPVLPITLELPRGRARLEPLTHAHVTGLFEAAQDEDIWRYMPNPMPRTLEEMSAFIDRAAVGAQLSFAVVDRADGRVAGTTRYLEIDPPNGQLEIGATWYGRAWRRTGINTECKLLLLGHAFEHLNAGRVFLKTDGRNARSQQAIMRLGTSFEGSLRRSRALHDGFVRDTVYFSVLREEWPSVKSRLEWLLEPK